MQSEGQRSSKTGLYLDVLAEEVFLISEFSLKRPLIIIFNHPQEHFLDSHVLFFFFSGPYLLFYLKHIDNLLHTQNTPLKVSCA